MVSEVFVEKEVADAEGIKGTEVEVVVPPITKVTPVKNEEDGNNNQNDDDDNDADDAPSAAVEEGSTSESPSRKRKADTLQARLRALPADPLVQFNIKINNMPSSISKILRLMDTLQPNQNYYTRQKDGRGECSKMRGKLRKYAKQNEEKLGVAHWVETKNWKPPDNEALSALMVLMRGMIDKSWPMDD